MKHFYRLILRVAPGGSRKHEEWIAGTLAEVGEALRGDLETGEGAYHAIFYGETIELECWEGRSCVARVGLHPCLTIVVEGGREFTFAGDGAALGLDPAEEEELDEEDTLSHRLTASEAIELSARIDWSRVSLPQLAGEPLRPGEEAVIVDRRDGDRTMRHGHHMLWG